MATGWMCSCPLRIDLVLRTVKSVQSVQVQSVQVQYKLGTKSPQNPPVDGRIESPTRTRQNATLSTST